MEEPIFGEHKISVFFHNCYGDWRHQKSTFFRPKKVQIYHCVCDHDACNAAAQTAAAAAVGAFASLLLATLAS